MADLSDVVTTLAKLADAAIYPNGDAQSSISGAGVTIAPGWPVPKQLDAIISAGNSMFTVYPMPGMDANVTRFLGEEPQPLSAPTASLTMTVSGNQVTIGGSIRAGEAAFIAINRLPYSHQVLATDTLDSIASALAAAIPNASAGGAVVTIGGNVFEVDASVSMVVDLQAEIARQKRVFMLTTWAPTIAARDAIASGVDIAFKVIPGRRILLPDNSYGILIYRGTLQTDDLATRKIYRRDLRYEVEYATTQQSTSNTITNVQSTLTPTGGASVPINTP